MKSLFSVVFLPLLLGGCASTLPSGLIAGDPADATSGIRATHYHSPVAGFVHRDPVDPKPWRDLNDAQSPKARSAS